MIALLSLMGSHVHAETYSYAGPTFTTAFPPYTTAMSINGSVTTSAPIPPNSVDLDITPLITSWTFSDGVRTLSSANGDVIHPNAAWTTKFTTNALGNISSANISVTNTPVAAAFGETNNLIFILGQFIVNTAEQNSSCNTVSAGSCNSYISSGVRGTGPSGVWASSPTPTYTVGGTASGLTGSVTLQNNGSDDIIKTTNDGFTFPAQAESTGYAVAVSSQPTGQTCTVTGGGNNDGSGTNITANINNIAVTCVDDVVPPRPQFPATPVPTMSVWGLGMLITIMGLIGFNRRRKM